MLRQVAAAAASARSARPGPALNLKIAVPERPKVATIVEKLQQSGPIELIILPNLLLNPTDFAALLAAFEKREAGSIKTIHLQQFATNPHSEPREYLVQLWHVMKYKAEEIIWEENRFFKSFFAEITQEVIHDPKVARCKFQNHDNTSSCATEQSTPGIASPQIALSVFSPKKKETPTPKDFGAAAAAAAAVNSPPPQSP